MSISERGLAPAGAGRMRRALVVAGCGVLTVTVAACESTEQESAKIGRESPASAAGQQGLKLGASNHSLKVASVTQLSSEGRGAIAVHLHSSSSHTQSAVPIQLEVMDSAGKPLYSNATGGLEASLEHVPSVPAKGTVWWVDDQVPSLPSSARISVKLGTGRRGTSGGALSTESLHVGEQSGISVVDGKLVNHSHSAQKKTAVFVVLLKGAKVIAAGRAVVESLSSRPGATASFQAFLVGHAAGSDIETTPGAGQGER
jgi:hypothetical protein